MGAMPEEINGVTNLIANPKTEVFGQRTFTSGQINGIDVVVVFSRWGKVAAAATVVTLIHEYQITELYFTGVAGAIQADLNIGDIVIAKQLVQHDMDARPLMPRYEIPLLSKTFFETNAFEMELASKAVTELLQNKTLHKTIDEFTLSSFNITHPKLVIGNIASGDLFFETNEQKENLNANLPSIACVEMEGAAVAQVCYEYDIPFCVIRTISDAADAQSHIDFPVFIEKIASKYSAEIIINIFTILKSDED